MTRRILGLAAGATLLAAWTARPASVTYVAQMTGAQETPATGAKGTGTATLRLDGNMLHYAVVVHGLTGTATAAHIHVGAVGVAGPPVYTFSIKHLASGTIAEGTLDLAKGANPGISGDSLKTLLGNGNAYVNVHTAASPNGEIRGQVMKK